MAMEECDKYRLISVCIDERSAMMAPVTLEATQEMMHVMALEQYKKILTVRIEERHGAVLRAMHNRAEVLLGRAEVDQSLVDLDEVELDVANTFHKIAVIYKTQDKYDLAVYNFKKCLAIQIVVLGETNLDVGCTKLHIAEVRTVMNVLRATGAVLRRATRAERNDARAIDHTMQRIDTASSAIRPSEASIRAIHAMVEFDQVIRSPLQFRPLQ